ncbi:group III truncated hemoglobin [Arenibacter sp. 6A1]|uniref:group III truncated hemoglobin n=1 Tax=Arenibacter sp. 6A1 TaxID=2720391 RepID=UPI0014480270|nr:group III truncated hemoglobin [Arenibacter sp. 6A1]NKI27046.1 group III truncated hemoglobin [Arenibacter sp. 6A1]
MVIKTEIRNRKDVNLLVITFYGKIRQHPILGPIFNGIIKDWESHLELLTDFWESQLLLQRKYVGNPIVAHQEVDAKINHSITPEHFGLWLNEWYATIDELFEGDIAHIAKNRAQKMSTMLYMHMYQHRHND